MIPTLVPGLVRNRADGSVGLVAEGSEPAVRSLVDWCRHGPPHAVVDDVRVDDEEPRGENGFTIRR